MFPQRWQEFRRARLTALLTKIRATVKSRRPGATLSAAVFPDASDATTRRFQEWGHWLETGLLDAICPMAYTTDPALFRAQIANVELLAGQHPVWAGIGAYQLSPSATVDNIRTARQLGAEGIILFSYDNLNSSYVETVAECRVSLARPRSSSAVLTSARTRPRSWKSERTDGVSWQQAFGRLDYDARFAVTQNGHHLRSRLVD